MYIYMCLKDTSPDVISFNTMYSLVVNTQTDFYYHYKSL